MEYSENTTMIGAITMPEASPFSSLSPTTSDSSSLSPASLPVILSPCAACKILRRRCVEKCLLAPYFPPTEPLKFTIAHRVFGASNIIKLLQELPESQRSDAVNSMVYEANARLRDPVYGCAGAICHLQKQISDLKAELAKAQAENLNIQYQNANLLGLICNEMETQVQQGNLSQGMLSCHDNSGSFFDDNIMSVVDWEHLLET